MMQELLENCGLIATFIATLMEGEIFFITAIISSKFGAFSTSAALIVGFLGSYTQGLIIFYAARNHGLKLLKRNKKLHDQITKNAGWFDKNPMLILMLYKFFFGLTTAILILAGLREISYLKFAIFTAISSFLWVTFFGLLAYYCADIVLSAFETLANYKFHIIGVLILIGLYVFYAKHKKNLQNCVEVILE